MPDLPLASEEPEHHADWLEWRAFLEGHASWAEHQRDLGIGGGDEGEEGECEAAPFELLIDAVAAELSERTVACGSRGYPFVVEPEGLTRRTAGSGEVYWFLLLLSLYGKGSESPEIRAEQLFEELCAEAFGAYLGKPREGVETRVFGFPRRIGPKGFAPAVDLLCRSLGEGDCHCETPRAPHQKDAHLDLVAWRGFPDRKAGQLIAFGQCATGANWFQKIHELRPEAWCRLWLKRLPLVMPLGSLFVPHRIERDLWREANTYGGIVFDRCRISWLAPEIPASLASPIRAWIDAILPGKAL